MTESQRSCWIWQILFKYVATLHDKLCSEVLDHIWTPIMSKFEEGLQFFSTPHPLRWPRGVSCWPCLHRHCNWLPAVSHNCPGKKSSWESRQWLRFRRWFLPGTGFIHHLQLVSHDIAEIWQKKWQKSKVQIPFAASTCLQWPEMSWWFWGHLFGCNLNHFLCKIFEGD